MERGTQVVIRGAIPGSCPESCRVRQSDLGITLMANDDPTQLAEPSMNDLTLRERFDTLVSHWKRERGPHSSSARLTSHPAYQDIIGLGPAVVPLLLKELERAPDHRSSIGDK